MVAVCSATMLPSTLHARPALVRYRCHIQVVAHPVEKCRIFVEHQRFLLRRVRSGYHSGASQCPDSRRPPGSLSTGRARRAGWMRLVVYIKLKVMISLNEIEDAVLRLTPAELDAFRAWFAEFDAAAWDRQ